MLSFNRSIITGGTFTQVNNNLHTQSQIPQTPRDCLLAAVAPAALHNAAKRFDAPRCHPNTRIGVMDELRELALRRGDPGGVKMLWLNGGAGAGKSAIAQSFCEECFSKKLLLASFFFNRSDPSRNNAKSFVATLAYQIYREVPTHNQSLILAVIENDPLVFEQSIDSQFTSLIMNPLRDLVEGAHFVNKAPSVIVIDGLDECATGAVQVSILTALQNISVLPQSPFVFVITSRPEHDIRMFFSSSASGLMGSSIRRLRLDKSYHTDADIELFLREKIQEVCTTNPHKDSIPQGWPSNKAIETLVSKSSGHFIYPSVVIKYLTSGRDYPPHQLNVVLGLCPPRQCHPLAELDALYSHILSSAEDINLVLQIFRIVLLFQVESTDLFARDVEQLCELDRGECLNALCDLQSVVQIDPPEQSIHFLHKSLSDYLQDPSRSCRFYVDDTSPEMIIPLITSCLRIMSGPTLDYNPRLTTFFRHYLSLLVRNIQMCHKDLMSLSLVNCRKSSRTTDSLWDSFEILNVLYELEGTEYEYIYHYHLHQFPQLARHYPEVYGSWDPNYGIEVFFMIMIFVLLGNSEVHIPVEVFDLLRPLSSVAHWHLTDIASGRVYLVMNRLRNLKYSDSAAFAFECLCLVLPYTKHTSDLNEACHSLCGLLAHSTGRSLTYDCMGRPYAQMGYTVAEMCKMTMDLEHSACKATQEYMERYAEGEISDLDEESYDAEGEISDED